MGASRTTYYSDETIAEMIRLSKLKYPVEPDRVNKVIQEGVQLRLQQLREEFDSKPPEKKGEDTHA